MQIPSSRTRRCTAGELRAFVSVSNVRRSPLAHVRITRTRRECRHRMDVIIFSFSRQTRGACVFALVVRLGSGKPSAIRSELLVNYYKLRRVYVLQYAYNRQTQLGVCTTCACSFDEHKFPEKVSVTRADSDGRTVIGVAAAVALGSPASCRVCRVSCVEAGE